MINSREKFIELLEEKFDGEMYGDLKYIVHCFNVENMAIKFLLKYPRIEAIRLACLGHDLIEDTDITIDELRKYISGDIIDLIERVSDKEGKNRRERHLNTYCYIREKEEAVLVKLCDRLSNLEESLKSKNENKKSMYKKEFNTFKSALYDPRHQIAKPLWEAYDKYFYKL
jgi:(p)ppGpp synthase/HD superfamily hydrolase